MKQFSQRSCSIFSSYLCEFEKLIKIVFASKPGFNVDLIHKDNGQISLATIPIGTAAQWLRTA
jgi:hypothetical protein